MIDVKQLKACIADCGLNNVQVAAALGVDYSTLYRKLERNGETITLREAGILADLLDLSAEQKEAIFFVRKLASAQETQV